MTIAEFLAVCKQYNDLGWAVQEQLGTVVRGGMNKEGINLNALEYIVQWLYEVQELASGPDGNDKLLRETEETLQYCEDYKSGL